MSRGTRFLYELKARKGEISQDDPTLKFLRAKDSARLLFFAAILAFIGVMGLISWWNSP
jgi:hypothetical protein